MPRWIRRLAVAAIVLSGCAWPRVRCSEESPPVSVFLDAIERLVELHKPKQADAIREALFVCREDAHSGSRRGGALTQSKHCAFVVAAFRYAAKKEFEKCLTQLMHGSGATTPGTPDFMRTEAWPDILCAELTAREMLEFIRTRLDGPGGLPPHDPLRADIIQGIDNCLRHPASGPLLTLAQHCRKVQNAFAEASKPAPNWVYVSNELDHMP